MDSTPIWPDGTPIRIEDRQAHKLTKLVARSCIEICPDAALEQDIPNP
jgi:hypothetical protein